MKISQFMAPKPVTLKEENTIKHAAEIFLKHSIDGVPVVDKKGKIKGIFTKTHLYRALVKNYTLDTPVSSFMKKNVITINISNSVDEAWQVALRERVGRLPVVDNDGNLVGMMTRTNLVQAFEKELFEIINRLNAILNSAHNGIYAINRDGIIITYNKAAERLVGLKSSKVIGKKIIDFEFDFDILEVLKSGKPQFGKKMFINENFVIINRTPVVSGDIVIGAVAVIQDISELESVSKELNETIELCENLDAVINSSYDGIAMVNQNSDVIHYNRAYKKMGLNNNKIIKNISFQAIKTSRPVTLVHQSSDGRELLLTANPVHRKNARKITRVVVNCRDITELNNLRREVKTTKKLSEIYHLELETLRTKYMGHTIVCNSQAMRNILDLAIRVAKVDSTILILGESGVGKDVVARLIHKASKRAKAPFIRINCGAIPENLLESELFGYEPGAFTGANRGGKPGLFELAHTGTLFLDEIAEMPLPLQVKLLNVIQEREVTRLGGTKPVNVDIRLIAATNKELDSMVRNGSFRIDLYYRLNVVPITVPPLRERRDDIPSLVIHFLRKFNEKYHLNKSISPDAMDYLINYNWPGNVRELENLIERLVVITTHDTIKATDLPNIFLQQIHKLKSRGFNSEKELIKELYQRMKSTRKVAEALGVHQSTIVRKMKKYNIKPITR